MGASKKIDVLISLYSGKEAQHRRQLEKEMKLIAVWKHGAGVPKEQVDGQLQPMGEGLLALPKLDPTIARPMGKPYAHEDWSDQWQTYLTAWWDC